MRRIAARELGSLVVASFMDRKILREDQIQEFSAELLALVEAGHTRMVLSFDNLDYFSSAAFGKLITLQKKIELSTGKLAICCVDLDIYEVFEMTRLSRYFKIFKEEEQALEFVRS